MEEWLERHCESDHCLLPLQAEKGSPSAANVDDSTKTFALSRLLDSTQLGRRRTSVTKKKGTVLEGTEIGTVKWRWSSPRKDESALKE